MSDFPLPEDTATRYVLGELDAAERRAFEAQLAESADLRTLVRDLTEGATALAISVPRKVPPAQVWQQIEKTIGRIPEAASPAGFWTGWWRNGWAVASACLVGWLLFAFWTHRPGQAESSNPSMASSTHPQPAIPPLTIPETAPTPDESNALRQSLQAKAREIDSLHQQIAGLQSRLFSLAQTVTQQQAELSEPSRFKIFQLTGAGGNASAVPSPAQQQLLMLAMAHELGWVQSSNAGTGENIPFVNPSNVDFVDLRPHDQNTPETPSSFTSTNAPANASANPSGGASGNVIPAFISGTNLVVAIDQSVAPAGSLVTFSTGSSQELGSAILGYNPTLFTMPSYYYSYGSSFNIYVSPSGMSSGFQSIYQFFNATTNSP